MTARMKSPVQIVPAPLQAIYPLIAAAKKSGVSPKLLELLH
jgi:hypothetical protein